MNGLVGNGGLTPLAIGLVVLLCAIGLLAVVTAQRTTAKRLQRRIVSVSGRAMTVSSTSPTEVTVRRDVKDSSIESLDKLIKQVFPSQTKLRERLAATGKRISVAEYYLASLLVGVAVFGIKYLVVGKSLPLGLILGFTAMIGLPWKITGTMIARRQKKFLALFPEAIELIVRGLKSGVPISESIKVVGREVPDPVGVEFRNITDSMLLGQTFDEALAATSKRLNLPDFRFFEISLGIQQETGGNLAETLDNLGNILRKRKQMKQKVRALSSEARASAYILGSLPFIIFLGLYVVAPEYISILLHDPRGYAILGASGTFLAIGVGVMIRMGRFQI